MDFRCRICNDHLLLEVENDSDDEGETTQKVPDDLSLRCGCHYHWQCFIDQAADMAISLKCPSCQATLQNGQPAILARYVNEGGIEDNLDILPTITEEAYLIAHPEAQPARAYHVMCAEGDVAGIVEMLQNLHEENGGDIVQLGHLLRYRDPLAGGTSGIHLAIQKGREEVVWLLLWLASTVPTEMFPDEVRHMAESYRIQRLDMTGADIRALIDDAGQSARDIAEAQGGQWASLLNTGVLGPRG
ncbi:hypothetical protein F5X68DRAFT_225271 [Plectosphaerella plurivora]|uniref:Uncharacterized protein n=1 Tax=Plectosphaerella plurivora TaxID=936078 RepID=A0A9P8V223_9PEZI|nr:hypothetical protein F5X68DRAFT_225271 [Plectosphaerella plurivora]